MRIPREHRDKNEIHTKGIPDGTEMEYRDEIPRGAKLGAGRGEASGRVRASDGFAAFAIVYPRISAYT
eukprot:3333891-Pyramimonas_sp.AAC.2